MSKLGRMVQLTLIDSYRDMMYTNLQWYTICILKPRDAEQFEHVKGKYPVIKEFIWRSVAFVIILLVIFSILTTSIVKKRNYDLAKYETPSISKLTSLDERMNETAAVQAQPKTVLDNETKLEPIEYEVVIVIPPPPTNRLKRTMSNRELIIQSDFRMDRTLKRLKLTLEDSLTKITGIQTPISERDPYSVASEFLSLGELDAAKPYLWETIKLYEKSDPTRCKMALNDLAFLEDDPEIAVYLLQLSCKGECFQNGSKSDSTSAFLLFNAFNLCAQTDSSELAEYYQERIRMEYPIQFKRMEELRLFNPDNRTSVTGVFGEILSMSAK